MNDWDDIRIFLAVSRAGSLNAGARALGLTPPTVSRRIGQFERRLGVTLFGRAKDGLVLTEAGRSLWDRALAIEEQVEAVHRQVVRHDDRISGPVRVSATEGFGAYWLTKRLSGLSARHPHITLEIRLDNGLVDLMKRDADIAIRLARPVGRGLAARRVGALKFGLFASRAYVESHGVLTGPDDILRHRLVTFVWDSSSGGEGWRRLIESHPQIAFTSNSSMAQVQAIRAGYGVGMLPTYVQEEYPELVAVLAGEDWPQRDIWLVADRDVKRSARVRTVYDEIVAQFQDARRAAPPPLALRRV